MNRPIRGPFRLALALVVAGCGPNGNAPRLQASESQTIADSLRGLVRGAYDLTKPEPVTGFMSLYPDQGRVVSATAGRVTTSRDSLQQSIQAFWSGVGRFMVRPTWTWDSMEVDVLSRDAAVMTASYSVPHYTDRGMPHVIGGVWTSVWSRGDDGWRIRHEHLSDMPRAVADRLAAEMPQDEHAGHRMDGK